MKSNQKFLKDFEQYGNKNLEICEEYKGCNTPIEVKCKKCQNTFKMTPHSLLKGSGCKICSNRLVYSKINSFGAIHPELLPFFINKEEAFLYSVGSKHDALLQCPICKNKYNIKYYILNKKGFNCTFCNKMSYPNKFLHVLLQNIKDITNLQFEKTYHIDNKIIRYDAYFNYDNKEFVIEINGGQHYKNCYFNNFNVDIQYKQDILKQNFAYDNNIIYINIEAKKSDFLYIKEQVLNSKLKSFIPLDEINWENLFKIFNDYSLLKKICNDYENNLLSINELEKKYKIERHQISNFLIIGADLGLCLDYQSKRRRLGNLIYAYNNNNDLIGVYPSIAICAEKLNEKYQLNFLPNSISHVISGKQKTHRNFYFRRGESYE